jgi:alpha-soluble NSF attachment protein
MVEVTEYLQLAQTSFAKAQAKFRPGFFAKVFSNKVARLEEASQLFKQAANYFRIAKDFSASALAFERCAECLPDEAWHYLSEAADVARRASPLAAVIYYVKAAESLARSGRIGRAAKLRQQVAEIYEREGSLELAYANYERAGELFEMDNSEILANGCLIKAAVLLTLHRLDQDSAVKAIQVFEKVAQRALSNPITRLSAKDYYFKACLLYLVLEVQAI